MARKEHTPPATQADPDVVECMDCRCKFDLGDTVHWTRPTKEGGKTLHARCRPCSTTRAKLGYMLKKAEDSHSWFKENVYDEFFMLIIMLFVCSFCFLELNFSMLELFMLNICYAEKV